MMFKDVSILQIANKEAAKEWIAIFSELPNALIIINELKKILPDLVSLLSTQNNITQNIYQKVLRDPEILEKIQKEFYALSEKIITNGSDLEDYKMRFEVNSKFETTATSLNRQTGKNDNINSSLKSANAKIQSLAENLPAKFELSRQKEGELKKIIENNNAFEKSLKNSTEAKDVIHLKIGKVSGNPLVKAEAEIVRSKVENQKKRKIKDLSSEFKSLQQKVVKLESMSADFDNQIQQSLSDNLKQINLTIDGSKILISENKVKIEEIEYKSKSLELKINIMIGLFILILIMLFFIYLGRPLQ